MMQSHPLDEKLSHHRSTAGRHNEKQRRRKRRSLITSTLIATGLLAASGSVAYGALYPDEQTMINEGSVDPDIHDVYNRATRILPAPVGEYNQREDLLANAAYYDSKGFDRNFLTWAPIDDVQEYDPFWNSTREWAGCRVFDANGELTPNREMSGAWLDTFNGVPCPDPAPQAQRYADVRQSIGNGPVKLMRWGDAFIGMACGNFSRTQPPPPPLPTISGSKFEDLDGDGQEDPGEPAVAEWPITLFRNGVPVWKGTTNAYGDFEIELDAEKQPLHGYGTYVVVEGSRDGWAGSTGTRRTVEVKEGDGIWNYETLPFGNYRLASASGRKFEDMDGPGPEIKGPGLDGWVITATGAHGTRTATTASDGTFTIDKLRPGTYVVSETPQQDWEQSYPTGSTYTLTVQSGDDATGLDFGNFRRGVIEGHKFHDIAVDGVFDPSDPGVEGWGITVAGMSTTDLQTDGDGAYRADELVPGVYTVSELDQGGWRQTAPASGSYTVTVVSGGVVSDIDFGNVCLGDISIVLSDITGGPPITDFEVRVEEIDVPGVLDNTQTFPIEQIGGEITGLLPGTYQVTIFLDDTAYTTDPHVTVVDGRFAVVKTVRVENCAATDIVVPILTASSGFVTGGVLQTDESDSTAGFNAKTDRNGIPQGSLQFVEHATGGGLNLHTSSLDGIHVAEPDAWVWGVLEFEGETARFALHLVDAGEPGRNDRFELMVATGYESGFGITLDGGNVQLHAEK